MCKTPNCQGYLTSGQYQYDYCSTCRNEAFYHGSLPQPIQEFILSLVNEARDEAYERMKAMLR